jgi:hypothetical protein
VHRAGYVSTSSLLVLAGPGASTTWSFVLKAPSPRALDPRQARAQSAEILTAGFVGASIEPATAAPSDDESEHDHSEVAWRLKHLKRSVLKDATGQVTFEEGDDPSEFDRAVADMFARQSGPAEVAASLLSQFPLAGQVNLLTTGAFDSPQQLVSAGSLARGVAMVSLGSSAGTRGDWAVQGAMTQGDVASWMVSGNYLTRAPARHVLDVGMAYSLQQYDGSNPWAMAAVADGNRYAGTLYAIDNWSITNRVSLAYGARYASYGYIEKGCSVRGRGCRSRRSTRCGSAWARPAARWRPAPRSSCPRWSPAHGCRPSARSRRTVTTAEWHETAQASPLTERVPGLTRTGTERLHDLTTTLETEVPITETRVFALYRINTGYAGDRLADLESAPDARFDVQVTQSLPFMNFSSAQWEMLIGVRNLFRDIVDEASTYDELLVVRPPKRIVGGLTLRF